MEIEIIETQCKDLYKDFQRHIRESEVQKLKSKILEIKYKMVRRDKIFLMNDGNLEISSGEFVSGLKSENERRTEVVESSNAKEEDYVVIYEVNEADSDGSLDRDYEEDKNNHLKDHVTDKRDTDDISENNSDEKESTKKIEERKEALIRVEKRKINLVD